ncbi:hypothetical protein [Streptomyces sp. KL116D]|uniref:hypothetical protein n=1 Tax=Streptomyces sp. KL116D TaxID=3045152 RepID=UPI0035583733
MRSTRARIEGILEAHEHPAAAHIRGLLEGALDRDPGREAQGDQLQVDGDGVRAFGARGACIAPEHQVGHEPEHGRQDHANDRGSIQRDADAQQRPGSDEHTGGEQAEQHEQRLVEQEHLRALPKQVQVLAGSRTGSRLTSHAICACAE